MAPRADAEAWLADVPAALEALPAGHPFTVPENLFARITDEMREAMEARFAGK